MKKIILILVGFLFLINLGFSQVRVLADGSLQGNQSGAIRINTGHGYVDIGPKTSGSCHFYTDQSYFYFNKGLLLQSGVFTISGSGDYNFKKYSGSYPFMVIRNYNGYVGINMGMNNPQYQLDVAGVIRGANLSPNHPLHPDEKAGDQPLNHEQVQNLLKLEGINYTFDPLEIPGFKEGETLDDLSVNDYYKRNHLIFDPSVVEKLFPDMVYHDSMGAAGIINDEFIPLIVEVLKEQNELIRSLEKEISSLKLDEKSAIETEFSETEECWLEQNKPNPFNENTIIEYYLSKDIIEAVIYIYDLQGKQLRNIEVNQLGKGQVIIYGSELQPGIYNYSLIADGELIGIKKMILTE